MSRIPVRGLAVASATAVTTVGAVVGVASGSEPSTQPVEATAADATLLADIPAGQQAQVQTVSLTEQVETASTAALAEAKKSAEESARLQAAKDASAKKEAKEAQKAQEEAERKAEEEREAAEEASRGNERADFPEQTSYTIAEVQAMAREIVGSGQFQCFSNIVDHESGWNYQAVNPSSGAYGLVQAYPGSKMASVGADWQTNPATQIKWGLNYMNDRYGSPCGAWDFWQANNYY